MEGEVSFLDVFNHEFLFSTAKERYDRLLEMYPEILQLANLGHIASMLGINQETLSRVRKLK